MAKKTEHKNGGSAPQAKGYSEAGASLVRRALRAFIPSSSSPVEDIDWNNKTMRQRSRMLYMSAPVATSAINTMRTKSVGVGLKLSCAIDREMLGMSPEAARDWEKKTEAEFLLWAGKRENCDALGLNNFSALQQLAFLSWCQSGDCLALLKHTETTNLNPYSLRLHLVEADRVCTPHDGIGWIAERTEGVVQEGQPGAGNAIHDGVEVDKDGKVVAYHVCNMHPNQVLLNKERKWTRVLAFGEKTGLPNVLHVMSAERPDQYRGVPYLAKVIEPLLQMRRYTESELMAALIQSFFTAFVQTETDPTKMPFSETGESSIAGVPGENPQGVSDGDNDYELGPGTVNHLKPGENIIFGNPNIPTAGFDGFMKSICKQIGAALEIPYDVLMKEFNASYSASRAALLEMWEAVKMWRAWFVDDFCQPTYEVWLAEAVARGRIKAPGFFDDPRIRMAWCGANWIGPVAGQIDPKKEAEADILLINRGIKTHEQVTREKTGGDWNLNVEQLARETELLAAAVPAPAEPQTDPGGNGNGDD